MPLRHSDFARYAAGNTLSLIGTWAQRLALGWLIWEQTRSESLLGIAVFADLAPAILIAPLAGAFADRANPLKLLQLYQLLCAIFAALLALVTTVSASVIWPLIGLTFILGTFEALAHPLRLSLVHHLVPPESIGAAVAFNTICFNLARFSGPALCGFMLVASGPTIVFVFNAASYLIFYLLLRSVKKLPAVVDLGTSTLLADIITGIKYVVTEPKIAPSFALMAAVGLLVRPVIDLLPAISDVLYDAGVGELAVYTSAVAFGAMLCAVWLGTLPTDAPRLRIATASAAAMAIFTILLMAVRAPVLVVPLLIAVGAANVGTFISIQIILQMDSASNMRGRVLSLYGLVFRGAPALGALVAGFAADELGFQWPLSVAALAAAAGLIPFWLGTSRHRPRHGEQRDASDAEY